MYRLALFIVVASIVMGAAGVVYLINAIRRTENRRKHVALTTVFFFGCLIAALLAAHMTKRGGGSIPRWRMSAAREVRIDPSVMLAASAGAGSIMT